MRRTLITLGATVVAAAAVVAPVSAAPDTASKDITQVAASSPQFSTLVSLLKKARLAGALKQKGPFTVFAPTNAAFAKVPRATLNEVANNPALLKKVLTYHVVKGSVPATKVVTLDGKSARTLAGRPVKIAVRNGKVFLNGTTRVTRTDVMASNGVIHVINGVLIPSS